jgi:AraC-like DNA-binding protein
MKPKFLKVSTDPIYSFSSRRDIAPNVNNYWHRHPELELIKIENGSGILYIGNKMVDFKDGDLILIGANIPHYWKFEERYFEKENPASINIIVIHFSEFFWGESFLKLPENRLIKELIDKSGQGVLLRDKCLVESAKLLGRLHHAVYTERIMLLLQVLLLFTENNVSVLMPVNYKPGNNKFINERITVIYEYLLRNFKNDIQLLDVANVAGMTPNSFCRYLKAATGKTYSQLLIEIRVEHACKLLIENNQNMKYIGFEAGFNNLGSFYKNFKQVIGSSPLNYKKQFNVSNIRTYAA